MRPVILKVQTLKTGCRFSTEEDPNLIELRNDNPKHKQVIDAVSFLGSALEGRDVFYVLALASPNDEGGVDLVPTFIRALDPSEEPHW